VRGGGWRRRRRRQEWKWRGGAGLELARCRHSCRRWSSRCGPAAAARGGREASPGLICPREHPSKPN